MARRYAPEVHAFIAENVTGRTTRKLVSMVNVRFGLDFTESAMKSYKKNRHLKSGTPSGRPTGYSTGVYPQPVKEYIEQHYRGTGPTEMVGILNDKFGTAYTASQMKDYYANHKLNSGVTGYFEKGSIPFNKGQKGCFAPGSEKGWFPKGNLPADTKPIGYERVSKDGYIEVKIKMRPSRTDCNDNFVAKHRLIWEQAYGKIPHGHMVIFKDGDKRNLAPENLALITRTENQMLNKKHLRFNDAQLAEVGIMVAKVENAMFKKKRDIKNERLRK